MNSAIDEGHPISAELPLSTKLGARIWSQMSMTPVMSESDPSIVENHVSSCGHVHACLHSENGMCTLRAARRRHTSMGWFPHKCMHE